MFTAPAAFYDEFERLKYWEQRLNKKPDLHYFVPVYLDDNISLNVLKDLANSASSLSSDENGFTFAIPKDLEQLEKEQEEIKEEALHRIKLCKNKLKKWRDSNDREDYKDKIIYLCDKYQVNLD